jgi:hypothetical protein
MKELWHQRIINIFQQVIICCPINSCIFSKLQSIPNFVRPLAMALRFLGRGFPERTRDIHHTCLCWQWWRHLTSMGPCIVNLFLSSTNKMQRYTIFVYCQCSTCFGRVFRSSSGAQKLYMQHWVLVKLVCCDRCYMYSFGTPDDGRKTRSKHVEHWKK